MFVITLHVHLVVPSGGYNNQNIIQGVRRYEKSSPPYTQAERKKNLTTGIH